MNGVKKEEPDDFGYADAHVLADDAPDANLPELPQIAARKRRVVLKKRGTGKKRKTKKKKSTKSTGKRRKTTRRKKKVVKKPGDVDARIKKIVRRKAEPKLHIRQNDDVIVLDEEVDVKPPLPPPPAKPTPSNILDQILFAQEKEFPTSKPSSSSRLASKPKAEPRWSVCRNQSRSSSKLINVVMGESSSATPGAVAYYYSPWPANYSEAYARYVQAYISYAEACANCGVLPQPPHPRQDESPPPPPPPRAADKDEIPPPPPPRTSSSRQGYEADSRNFVIEAEPGFDPTKPWRSISMTFEGLIQYFAENHDYIPDCTKGFHKYEYGACAEAICRVRLKGIELYKNDFKNVLRHAVAAAKEYCLDISDMKMLIYAGHLYYKKKRHLKEGPFKISLHERPRIPALYRVGDEITPTPRSPPYEDLAQLTLEGRVPPGPIHRPEPYPEDRPKSPSPEPSDEVADIPIPEGPMTSRTITPAAEGQQEVIEPVASTSSSSNEISQFLATETACSLSKKKSAAKMVPREQPVEASRSPSWFDDEYDWSQPRPYEGPSCSEPNTSTSTSDHATSPQYHPCEPGPSNAQPIEYVYEEEPVDEHVENMEQDVQNIEEGVKVLDFHDQFSLAKEPVHDQKKEKQEEENDVEMEPDVEVAEVGNDVTDDDRKEERDGSAHKDYSSDSDSDSGFYVGEVPIIKREFNFFPLPKSPVTEEAPVTETDETTIEMGTDPVVPVELAMIAPLTEASARISSPQRTIAAPRPRREQKVSKRTRDDRDCSSRPKRSRNDAPDAVIARFTDHRIPPPGGFSALPHPPRRRSADAERLNQIRKEREHNRKQRLLRLERERRARNNRNVPVERRVISIESRRHAERMRNHRNEVAAAERASAALRAARGRAPREPSVSRRISGPNNRLTDRLQSRRHSQDHLALRNSRRERSEERRRSQSRGRHDRRR